MKKVGLSTSPYQARFGDKRALEIAAEVGADAVDFSLDYGAYEIGKEGSVYNLSDEEIIAHFTELKNYAHSLGLEICQTHGRLPGFKNKPEEDDMLVKNARLDCIATAALGAPICVIHNATTIFLGPDAPGELYHKLSFDYFSRIIPYAIENGIKIATETFGDAVFFECCDFFGYIDEFEKAFNDIIAVDEFKDHFGVCVDTGHSNKATRFGNPSAGDVIRRMGKHVICLHLHDNNTLTDQHRIPMTGNIDWDDVFSALEEVGYDGVYNLELNPIQFGEFMVVDAAEFGVRIMKKNLAHREGKL